MQMSELQLWAVIAAPSVLALVGILLNQAGISRLDHRMDRFQDQIDKRFDAVDKKFDAVNARIDAVNARIDRWLKPCSA